MTTMFKVGDRVRCIRGDASDGLTKDAEYTVSRCGEYFVGVAGVRGGHSVWDPSRFELIEEPTPPAQRDTFYIVVGTDKVGALTRPKPFIRHKTREAADQAATTIVHDTRLPAYIFEAVAKASPKESPVILESI